VHWIGGSGDWDTAANWSSGAVPGALNDVTINVTTPITVTHGQNVADSVNSLSVSNANDTFVLSVGSLALAATSTFDGPFQLAGGTLTGAGNVTIKVAFAWTNNGTISGTVTVTTNGASTIGADGSGALFSGRPLANHGTMIWSGANWSLSNAAKITPQASKPTTNGTDALP
jgi:hypothetical protein